MRLQLGGQLQTTEVWTNYTRNLTEYPLFRQRWEFELASTVRSVLGRRKIASVLEVGCSNGRWLRWFAQNLGCKCYGLDSDATGFSGSDIEFQLGDARKMNYSDETFDFVFSLGLLEHFGGNDRETILNEQLRVLGKTGRLLCQIPNLWFSLEGPFVKWVYDYNQGYKHYVFRPHEIDRILIASGCRIIVSKYIGSFFERFSIDPSRKSFPIGKQLSKIPLMRLTRTEYLVVAQRN